MNMLAAVTPSALWFITRATGTVSLVLLTVTVALGIVNIRRTHIGDTPRFVIESVHRTAALLAVSFVAVHVVTTLLDGFAPIHPLDLIVPFRSTYRPVWLGLGTVAFDLLVALVVTSLLRRRLGLRAWRTTHWLAYACWPVALFHGLGTGSDTKTHWMLLVVIVCVAVVLASVALRISAGWPRRMGTRLSAAGAAALLPLGLIAWLPGGPLASGWAQRAGTPPALLASVRGAPATGPGRTGSAGSSAGPRAAHHGSSTSFVAPVAGAMRQVPVAGGLMLVDLSLTVHAQHLSNLHIRIRGRPIQGGGVQMTSSRVTFGPSSNLDQYHGQISGLEGPDVVATVSDGGGSSLALTAHLQIAPGPGGVSGTLSVGPASSPSP